MNPSSASNHPEDENSDKQSANSENQREMIGDISESVVDQTLAANSVTITNNTTQSDINDVDSDETNQNSSLRANSPDQVDDDKPIEPKLSSNEHSTKIPKISKWIPPSYSYIEEIKEILKNELHFGKAIIRSMMTL